MASETCSTLSKDIERFRCYVVPDDAKVEMPSSNQTIFDTPQGMVAVYMEFFDNCGLRFPLSAFFRECLLYYGVSITQLTPNSVKCVVGFEVLCRLANVKPSMALFAYFFLPTRILTHWYSISPRSTTYPKLLLNLHGSSDWKSKFVFVGDEMFPEKMVWKTNNHYPNPWLTGKVLDEVRILSVFGVDCSILLSEKMLHSAEMPNVYSGPLPVKFCDKNGNEISALDSLREMSPVESGGGNDGKLKKSLGGDATPSKRAKLSDGDDDDDDEILATIFAKNPPQESIPTTPSNKSVAGTSAAEFSSSLPRSTKDKRIAAVEAAFAALEEVKFGYKDADSELAAAQNLAENYLQGLNAEVKKNRVLQEALDKAKSELEAAKSRQGSALEKARRDVEASQTEASNFEQGLNAEVKKNVALKEDLENAKRELGEARNEASYYGDMYRQKLKAIMEFQKSLETAKKELDAEKKRSAIAREEANEAKQSAAAAKQEVSDLHSRIHDFYLQCCSKD